MSLFIRLKKKDMKLSIKKQLKSLLKLIGHPHGRHLTPIEFLMYILQDRWKIWQSGQPYNIPLLVKHFIDQDIDINHTDICNGSLLFLACDILSFINPTILYHTTINLQILKLMLQHPKINIHMTFRQPNGRDCMDRNIYGHLKSVQALGKITQPKTYDVIQLHAYIDYVMALTIPDQPPCDETFSKVSRGWSIPYIILWILDWIPDFDFALMNELKKIRIIESVRRIKSSSNDNKN